MSEAAIPPKSPFEKGGLEEEESIVDFAKDRLVRVVNPLPGESQFMNFWVVVDQVKEHFGVSSMIAQVHIGIACQELLSEAKDANNGNKTGTN